MLNAVTTFRLIQSDMYAPTQKVLQSLVVLFFPLFGAVIISDFLNDEPVVLSEKVSNYVLIIQYILMPLMIKVKSNLDDSIENATEGYTVNDAPY